MDNPEQDANKRMTRFLRFASEHKLFSGLVGSLLVIAVALAPTIGKQDEDPSEPSSAAGPESKPPPMSSPTTTTEAAGGQETSAGARDTTLGDYIEAEEPESFGTENTTIGQVTVGAITDPLGIRMELSESYRSGALTVPTEGVFTMIHGQVGITSDPCSPGSTGEVAIRGEEGEPLWPKSGELQPVGRNPQTFDVPIGSTDAVVLYATAPVAEAGYCGAFLDSTEVGWVLTRLLVSE